MRVSCLRILEGAYKTAIQRIAAAADMSSLSSWPVGPTK